MTRNRYANFFVALGLAVAIVTATNAARATGRAFGIKVRLLGCDWMPDNGGKPDDHGTIDLSRIGTLSMQRLRPDLDWGVRNDAQELRNKFGVNARAMLLDEAGSPNACAIDYVFEDRLRAEGASPASANDGTVLLGTKLILSEYNQTYGQLWSLPTILSHEFAHIMQNKKGFPATGMWRELHADFMSGWFTAHRQRFYRQDANQAVLQLFRKGDGDFFSEDHHGTPQERANAFMAGYRLNFMNNVADANITYQAGIQYVNSQGANLSQSGTGGGTPSFFRRP